MSNVRLEEQIAALNRELERLEDELSATPLEERGALVDEIARIEQELSNLAIDQRNRSSMDAGSEA